MGSVRDVRVLESAGIVVVVVVIDVIVVIPYFHDCRCCRHFV